MRARRAVLLVTLALLATSCAYYNTFYLARRYYFKGTGGLPYPVERPNAAAQPNFTKAIDYSKKVMANYSKSKWVDDAYLLWARALLGRDDPRETVNMLQDFGVRFPDSKLKAEALFYLGVGFRQSHRYSEAEMALEQFLSQAPRHDLAPYAWLERARALTSLDRDSAAAFCAGRVLEVFPKSRLGPQALAARAEALLASGYYERARVDYQGLGLQSSDDEQRLGFLLKEADCLEAGRSYDAEMALLRDAQGHARAPATSTAIGVTTAYSSLGGADHYGRLALRIGTVHLLAGRLDPALETYREVLTLYPKSPLSAEAQYRIGYAYENAADDFERARGEYARVKDEFPTSAFATQAQQRMSNLERLNQFRSAGGDTLEKRAEVGLMLAEQYLFQLGKPERALTEYRRVAAELDSTPWAAKALNAEAWVLSRKLGRTAEAESLLWVVVRQYPATEAQLAARDYLEQMGAQVPDSLIKLPKPAERRVSPADTVRLTPPPTEPMPLGRGPAADSAARIVGRPGPRRAFLRTARPAAPAWDSRYAGTTSGAPGLAGDSPFTPGRGEGGAGADSVAAPGPPAGAARDTLASPAPGPAPRGASPDTASAAPSRPRPSPADSLRRDR